MNALLRAHAWFIVEYINENLIELIWGLYINERKKKTNKILCKKDIDKLISILNDPILFLVSFSVFSIQSTSVQNLCTNRYLSK